MQPEGEQTNKGTAGFELAALDADQYPVTHIPTFSTELPFFYFTKDKKGLAKNINYQGVDTAGRPVKWSSIPNRGVGVPGIEAHEVWTRLIKPTWEVYRSDDGRLPSILPLGGVRERLRKVG